ncbi:hypothetical protein HK098_002257 [Nowakowskiella sp. JEL0407]|nr:hypothetical protein HK098_002257 [Nowakowskiella sp. JEL0407]
MAEDPDTKLKNALILIQDAYDDNSRRLLDEISHWKNIATSQKQSIQALESDFAAQNRKLADLDRQALLHQQEKRAWLATKSTLLEKYNNLRKSAQQLDSFRKSIVSMVEYGPSQINLSDVDRSFIDTPNTPQNTLDTEIDTNLPNGRILESNMNRSMDDHMRSSTMQQQQQSSPEFEPVLNLSFGQDHSLIKSYDQSNGNESLDFINPSPADNKSFLGNTSLRDFRQPLQSKSFDSRKQTPTKNAVINSTTPSSLPSKSPQKMFTSGAGPVYRNTTTPPKRQPSQTSLNTPFIDAPTLYKMIRDALTAQDFEEFASNVAAFNSSNQTADETIKNIGRIVKDRTLFMQMKTLILTAISENGG